MSMGGAGGLGRSTDRGRRLGNPSAQLGGYGDRGEVVAAGKFGVPENKRRTQRKGDQQD